MGVSVIGFALCSDNEVHQKYKASRRKTQRCPIDSTKVPHREHKGTEQTATEKDTQLRNMIITSFVRLPTRCIFHASVVK